jgi:hypothetical protein
MEFTEANNRQMQAEVRYKINRIAWKHISNPLLF